MAWDAKLSNSHSSLSRRKIKIHISKFIDRYPRALLELAKQSYPFFFLDEKETKNQDLGFSAIKIGSLPKLPSREGLGVCFL